jgi:hypothetical protein
MGLSTNGLPFKDIETYIHFLAEDQGGNRQSDLRADSNLRCCFVGLWGVTDKDGVLPIISEESLHKTFIFIDGELRFRNHFNN